MKKKTKKTKPKNNGQWDALIEYKDTLSTTGKGGAEKEGVAKAQEEGGRTRARKSKDPAIGTTAFGMRESEEDYEGW